MSLIAVLYSVDEHWGTTAKLTPLLSGVSIFRRREEGSPSTSFCQKCGAPERKYQTTHESLLSGSYEHIFYEHK